MAEAETAGPPPGAPDEASAGGNEPFLSRWSRLKREAESHPVAPQQAGAGVSDSNSPVPELPPLEKLTFDSDYRQFFHPKVGEDVRRAALKKLFSDPRFNVMDGLDVYIDDYSKTEPIPAAMLATLKQAQNIFRWARGEGDEGATADALQPQSRPAAQQNSARLDAPETQPAPGAASGEPAADPSAVPLDGSAGPVGS